MTRLEIKVTLQCEVYEDFAYKQTKTKEVTLKKGVPKSVGFDYNYVLLGNPEITWQLTFRGDGISMTRLTASDYRDVLGSRAYFSYILLIDATGKKWQQGKKIFEGSFGSVEQSAELPGLQSSLDNFGEREYTLQSDIYGLVDINANDPTQRLKDIAKATVDALMRPTTRFNLDMSTWNKFAGFTPEQIGKKVILPSGLEGVLSDFAYSDDYEGDTPLVSCVVEITVTEDL